MTKPFSIRYGCPPLPHAHYGEVGGTQNLSGRSEAKDEVASVRGMKAYRRARHKIPLVLKLSTSVMSE